MWQAIGVIRSRIGTAPASEMIMQLLRTKQVTMLTGLSRMTIYRMERDGLFPARRKLGKNSVGWLGDDISEWIRSRPSGLVSRRRVAPQLSLFG
jgi:prophage regulatory protein